jgi:hypothetical protein
MEFKFVVDKNSDFCCEQYANTLGKYIAGHKILSVKGTKAWPDIFELGHVESLQSKGCSVQHLGQKQGAVDVVVGSEKQSLKTETRSNLCKDINITKLMTASWLEEVLDESLKRIKDHIALFDRLLVFRAKYKDKPLIACELIEVPYQLLLQGISTLTSDHFSPWTKNKKSGKIGSTSAEIYNDSRIHIFSICLEAHAGKVKLSKINRDLCVRHALFNFWP